MKNKFPTKIVSVVLFTFIIQMVIVLKTDSEKTNNIKKELVKVIKLDNDSSISALIFRNSK